MQTTSVQRARKAARIAVVSALTLSVAVTATSASGAAKKKTTKDEINALA